MSVSSVKKTSALSTIRSYILPLLIVVAGMMFSMGNLFASNAAPLPSDQHTATVIIAEHHSGGSTGGVLAKQ